ncbi:hypothetical protein MMC14_005143, partial [Varicellaria rhodocarpa]|nr:hypothetical protein [Varicellaria rhodocarpa]
GRSQSKGSTAISNIKKIIPESSGRLEFLLIDLSDFSTIKSGVEAFTAQEKRLDVLVNNAGVMLKGSSETRYNEVQIGANCIRSVRVLWAGSIAVQANSPQPCGMEIDDTGRPRDTDVLSSYGQSKVGNVFLAREYAKLTPQTGVVHACFNPGNLRTGLQRHWSGIVVMLMVSAIPSKALQRWV